MQPTTKHQQREHESAEHRRVAALDREDTSRDLDHAAAALSADHLRLLVVIANALADDEHRVNPRRVAGGESINPCAVAPREE